MKKTYHKIKDFIFYPYRKWIDISDHIEYKESNGGCFWMLLKIPLAIIGAILMAVPFVLGVLFCNFLATQIHPYLGWSVAGIFVVVYFIFFHGGNDGGDFYLGDDTGD